MTFWVYGTGAGTFFPFLPKNGVSRNVVPPRPTETPGRPTPSRILEDVEWVGGSHRQSWDHTEPTV